MILYPNLPTPPPLSVIDEATLCLHISYLIGGIETQSFPLTPDKVRAIIARAAEIFLKIILLYRL